MVVNSSAYSSSLSRTDNTSPFSLILGMSRRYSGRISIEELLTEKYSMGGIYGLGMPSHIFE